jgi:uncharacterized protein
MLNQTSDLGIAIAHRSVMVPMRDGVRLATDVYFPLGSMLEGEIKDAAKFPAILERTPYGKNVPSRSERSANDSAPHTRAQVAAEYTEHGYIVVYQDCRGRYDSEGEFVKYLSESADGHDTCDWIVRQSWSNGAIGMKGLSYAAHTQMAAASMGSPGLKAMVVDSGGFSNAYQSGIRQGGAYELKQAAWAVMFAAEHSRKAKKSNFELTPDDLDRWFKRMPWRRGDSPLTPTPDYEDFLFDQWERGAFDEYWMQPALYAQGHYPTSKKVAAIHISSWYDVYSRTAVENFVGTNAHGGDARLILGPWTHGNRWETFSGDVDFGPQARLEGNIAPSLSELRRCWFDRWLKDLPEDKHTGASVQIFVMGGGSGRRNQEGRLDHGGYWRKEEDWPIERTTSQRFYLHKGGVLSTDAPTQIEASDSYVFDPADPVITLGGSVVSRPPSILAGGYDQVEHERFFGCRVPGRAHTQRADVLVFQSEILTQDVEVTGDIVVELWISSDALDTDFTAKLIDVYPPNADYPSGYALNLTDGIIRTRYRESWEKPKMLLPHELCKVQIQMFPTSNLFCKGHRIRVDISSSNFPKFDINPNTGDDEAKASDMRIAINTVYLNRNHSSSVVLPIVPNRSLESST